MTATQARTLAAAAAVSLAALAALRWAASLLAKLRVQGIVSAPSAAPSPADVSGLLAEASRITREAAL